MQVNKQKDSISSNRSRIDEDIKLKLFSCLEEWNKNRWFTSVYEIGDNGDKIRKVGIRPVTEGDKIKERKLLEEMLK